MKPSFLCVMTLALPLSATLFFANPRLHAQASEIPSASSGIPTGQTPEQRGNQLLKQMVEALGGDTWLGVRDMTVKGRTAAFFRGAPTGSVVEYSGVREFPVDGKPYAERIGFITDKSMIFPGKKIDIVQIWTAKQGYEVTFKGKTTLPAEQVTDYYRRRNHSVEAVVHDWIKQPGVMILAEGVTQVERRQADKVTILSANNDAVTLELDTSTHLPLRRTFEWRNEQFKDHDEDAEEYDDYHTIQGLPTAMTVTRYHNGDMISQRFYTKVDYNTSVSPELFNPDNLLKKKQ